MNKEKIVYIISIIVIIGFIVLAIMAQHEKSEIKRHERFTIGITISIIPTARSGPKVYYKYYVNNKIFNGDTHFSRGEILIVPDGRYFVRFSSNSPEYSEMLINEPVPGNIVESPIEGWETLPIMVGK